MDARDSELTLERLAHKLEALQRENAENAQRLETLERENAELRREVTAPSGPGTHRTEPDETRSLVPRPNEEQTSRLEGPVSRRALLGKAGAAAVAAMAAGTLLIPREAKANHVSTENFTANTVVAHFVRGDRTDDFVPAVTGVNRGAYAGMEGINTVGGEGVRGESSSGTGVYGEGGTMGVEGTATATGGTGVQGTGRYGVWGESNRAGFYGVTGRNSNTDGTGVRGVANNTDGRTGVRGEGATRRVGQFPQNRLFWCLRPAHRILRLRHRGRR